MAGRPAVHNAFSNSRFGEGGSSLGSILRVIAALAVIFADGLDIDQDLDSVPDCMNFAFLIIDPGYGNFDDLVPALAGNK
jgi:hypothetical protein